MVRRPRETRRLASVSVGAIVALAVLLLIAGTVFYITSLREAKTETQTGADAASLAAARALATDDLLTPHHDRDRAGRRLSQARDAAVLLGHVNLAAGRRLELDRNDDNHPSGDIVLGSLDHPLGGTFTSLDPKAEPAQWSSVNAVQVTTHRGPIRPPLGVSDSNRDILSRSVAMLDWSVVGFRPRDDSPVPLAPIGLFTDHTGDLPHSCSRHLRNNADDWSFDPDLKKWSMGRDGIREIEVLIGRRPEGVHAVPGVFLQLGAMDLAGIIGQLNSGVTKQQLETKLGSGFCLNHDNVVQVTGSAECPGHGHSGREALERAFRRMVETGEARIWPLISGGDVDAGNVGVTGWIGARVISVADGPGGGLALRLQLAVVCHPATVTERREHPPAFWATNRTVCRVRLAE